MKKLAARYKDVLASTDAILKAVHSLEEWSWLKDPNPLYRNLRAKVSEIQEKSPVHVKRMMLGEDLKKLVCKDDMIAQHGAALTVLDPLLSSLEALNKKVSSMHALSLS
jgi:hypothetical protein